MTVHRAGTRKRDRGLTVRPSRRRFSSPHSYVFLVSAWFLVAGCHRRHDQSVLASVLAVEHQVILRDGNLKPPPGKTLSANAKLSAGAKVETKESGAAALSLLPGIFVEIQPHTILTIEELRVSKDGNETDDAMKSRFAAIRLQAGAIRANLPNHGTGHCKFEVKIGTGMISARRRSLFSVRVQGDSVRIVCVHGKVRWRREAGEQPIAISAGDFIDLNRSEKGVPEPKAFAKDIEVEAEAEAIIGTSGFLEDLAARERNALAPWRR